MNEKETIEELQQLLDENRDKRVVVIGTTCSGKTTLLKDIKNAHDMDDLIFPLLTPEETSLVCDNPWTPEIGKIMTNFVKDKIEVKKGTPLFGTVLLDADLIIYLKISDKVLKGRTSSRNSSFEDAVNMKKQIEEEIKNSKIPIIEFFVG